MRSRTALLGANIPMEIIRKTTPRLSVGSATLNSAGIANVRYRLLQNDQRQAGFRDLSESACVSWDCDYRVLVHRVREAYGSSRHCDVSGRLVDRRLVPGF